MVSYFKLFKTFRASRIPWGPGLAVFLQESFAGHFPSKHLRGLFRKELDGVDTNTLQLLLGFTVQIMYIYIYICITYIRYDHYHLQINIKIIIYQNYDDDDHPPASSTSSWPPPPMTGVPKPWSFVHSTPLRNCLGWFPFGSRSEKVSGNSRNENVDSPQWKTVILWVVFGVLVTIYGLYVQVIQTIRL